MMAARMEVGRIASSAHGRVSDESGAESALALAEGPHGSGQLVRCNRYDARSTMALLQQNLDLKRCPHCAVNLPFLTSVWEAKTTDHSCRNPRVWCAYKCQNCGGIVTAWAQQKGQTAIQVFPRAGRVDEALPEPARNYLAQALDSLHAPAGATMLAASAVDAMLKGKGYTKGVLNIRIDKAAEDHLITEGMAKWAHQVRLDANDPRHADTGNPLPTEADARQSCEFAAALGDFLFVIPSRVTRGIKESTNQGDV